MIHFVDSIVSAKTGLTGINESYNAYIDKLSSDVFSGGNFTPLVNDAAKFQFLELIDNEAFSAIWGKQTIYPDWSSRPIQMLYLNSGGKYKHRLWATVFLLNIAEPLEVSERYKENQDVE